MTIQVFSNNAQTTLANPISAVQTTIQVAAGTGALFPVPAAGQAFKVTLTSVAGGNREICLCTNVTGDILTIVRAQESTTGQNFTTNDTVGHYPTAGVMADLVQSEQYQAGTYDAGTAAGTA